MYPARSENCVAQSNSTQFALICTTNLESCSRRILNLTKPRPNFPQRFACNQILSLQNYIWACCGGSSAPSKKRSSCYKARSDLLPKARRRTTTWHAFSPIRVTTMAPFASCDPQSNCGQISATPRHSSACCFNEKETPSQRLRHFVTLSEHTLRVPKLTIHLGWRLSRYSV